MEGVTEWLPISSTGHLLLLDEILALPGSPGFKDSFFIFIQLGAVLAVVTLFWEKMVLWRKTERGGLALQRESALLWAKAIIACLPGATAVILTRDVEERLESPWVIAAALIGYGIVFLVLESGNKMPPRIDHTEKIRFRDAFGVGLFQVLSIVPGTSRSGSTILGGLCLGMERSTAAAFSFFLAVPVMAGYSAVKLMQNGIDFTPEEWMVLAVGTVTAYGTSLLTVKRLTAYLKAHTFVPFGWYRIALGVAVLIKSRICFK